MIFDAAGTLYGATSGVTNGYGAIYKLTPAAGGGWKESVLHHFTRGKDGWGSRGAVLFDANGNLYDTTHGDGFKGTVFEITK